MKLFFIFCCFAYMVNFSDAQIINSFKIKFYYNGGDTSYDKDNLKNLVANNNFKTANPTVLYFYTPLQSSNTFTVKEMRTGYNNANINFLLFDLNPVDYTVLSLEKITDQLATAFITAFDGGLNILTFDVVAIGAGTDFAAHFGRKVKSQSTGRLTLPRIVAIEPIKLMDSLADTDANFVMTIHTENLISSSDIKGHVAFWVNGGKDQPKCGSFFLFYFFNKLCSFKAAQQYWLEAVKSQSATAFPARKCNSYDDFKNNACSAANPIVYMNTKTVKPTLTGDYYLNVNKESPYSKATADP